MNAERLLALHALIALASLAACSQPRTPEPPANADTDAGELTCDEKARAETLCRTALRQRCESQANDCEVGCETRGDMPANTQKESSMRGEMESTQCRENCRHTRDGCLVTVVQRCPASCQ